MAEDQESGSYYTNTLIVFFLGVAVGATVAILYAPMTGQEARSQIVEKAGKLRDKATELKEQAVVKAASIKEQVANVVKRGSDGSAASGEEKNTATA